MTTPTPTLVESADSIAQANNIMIENDKTIAEQQALIEKNRETISALEKTQEALKEENTKIFADGQEEERRKQKASEDQTDSISTERQALEKERAEMNAKRQEIADEKTELEKLKAETEKIRLENEQAKAELESKQLESKRLTENREGQIVNIREEKEAVVTEQKRLEVLKNQIEEESKANQVTLARIKEAQKDVEVRSDDANKTLEQARSEKTQAVYETQAATFAKNEAHHLIAVFRQALTTFATVNGTTIRIPELNDEHRKFIAKDLIEQCEECKVEEIFPLAYEGKVVATTLTPEPVDMLVPETYENLTKQEVIDSAATVGLTLDKKSTHAELVEALINHLKTLQEESK